MVVVSLMSSPLFPPASPVHGHPSYRSIQLNSSNIHSHLEKRNSECINQHNTSSDSSGKSPELQTLFLSVSGVTRWMVFITSLTTTPPPSPNPPPPSPFSAWKQAWCPLKLQTQAKDTLLSPGNLGPAESPQTKGKLCIKKRLCKHPLEADENGSLAGHAKMVHISLDLALLRLISILI